MVSDVGLENTLYIHTHTYVCKVCTCLDEKLTGKWDSVLSGQKMTSQCNEK